MRKRIRAALVAVTLVLAGLGSTTLAVTFAAKDSHVFHQLIGWATIASFLAVAIIALADWERAFNVTSAAELDLPRIELRLGQLLAREAQDAKRSLTPSPGGRGHPVNLRFEKATSPFTDYGGRPVGDLDSIAGYFRSLSSQRLVVLGAPGSGKTVLAVELQIQLLKMYSQNHAHPLPVLVDAKSYRPGQTWATWLAGYLVQQYALPKLAATRLVGDGRILSIIDGLDELERAMATSLISELNVFLREPELSRGGDPRPMVITCREAQYQDLAGPLDEAAHVEVQPLTTRDVKAYLREIGAEIPNELASLLTNPLMLSQVGAIYDAGANNGRLIEDLVHLPDQTAVERDLLAAFLADAYLRNGHGRNWAPDRAEGWLALIGSQMRELSTDGYAWRQVALAMPTGLLGTLSGTITGLGLLVAFTALGIARHAFGGSTSLGTAIGSLAALSIVGAGVAALLAESTKSSSLLSLEWADPSPLAFLRSELLSQQQGPRRREASARADLIQSCWRSLTCAALIGVVLGILAAALNLVGWHQPRDATIVFECYAIVALILCTPWGSFQLARAWFSIRRELPYRLMDFLDDAREGGILQPVGLRFEFRNHAVREYFSDPARLPKVRRDISELTKWVLGNLEIRESYLHVGADKDDIEEAVRSLATETILAGQYFAADVATQQAALERVRVRLNQLGHRSAFAESLVAREAPGLGAILDPSRVIHTRAMDDLARLIDRTPSASVGISGIRGIGKSTLIRWLCTEKNTSHRLPTLGIYVTAPVEYDAKDFLIHLYITLCNSVITDDRFPDRWPRLRRPLWHVTLAAILAAAGTSLSYHNTVATMWAHDHGSLWYVAASVLYTGALFILTSVVISIWRRSRAGQRRKNNIKRVARDRRQQLRYQEVKTTSQTGNFSGPFGLSFSGSRSRQVTEKQMTLPELVDSYRQFAGFTVSELQELVRGDGPVAMAQVRLVVGIDEIDRIEDAGKAEKFLNDIKAIFGIPNCFYIASLSADALANFERRVASVRTAFDSTFDTIIRIGPLELGTARKVLERRAIGLPYPFIALCYILSGGVPRELMRIARAVFDARNDVWSGFADQGAVACTVIAPKVITREMDSLRQGLLPMATQLSVPGATELIGLLDDPDWPSWDTQDDLAKLAKVAGQRRSFQDEAGNIAAAAKICDSLFAASYFFLSVNELFRSQLNQIVAELKRYDISPERHADASSIHLLARARDAIGVNPALAVTRVRAARRHYGLSDIPLILLSQLSSDTSNS